MAKVLAKLLSGIFAEEEILTEAQGRFRSERRYADQILILRGVCTLAHYACNISPKHGSVLNAHNDFICRYIERVTSRKRKNCFGSRCEG